MVSAKILVVEDNHIISEELKFRLESLGLQVCGIAHKAKQAINLVREMKPDLVLMDIVLNDEMDGIEAAKIIGEKYHVPIIYLTAYADDDTISKAKDTNPYGYIIKPFNEVILKSNIEIALNKFYLENKIRENESILASTLDSLDEGIFRTDKLGNILFMNESAEKLTGKKIDSCLNKRMADIFEIEIINSKYSFHDLISPVLDQGESIFRCNSKFLKVPAEDSVFIEISAMPIKDASDKISGCVLVFQNITDRTDRVEIEKKLIEARDRAEFASKIKSEFLAQMSHEIRTPLNVMISSANLLQEEIKESVDEDVYTSFELIDSAGRRIIRTIDLLLNMSEIHTGTYDFVIEEFNLNGDVLEQVFENYKLKAKSKALQLILSCQTDDTIISGDRYSILEIFSNLVDNAIKYTESGRVEIIIDKDELGNLAVLVVDTGIGISKEYLPHLFDKFTQEDEGYTRKFEGNGLGLALVKEFCSLNNLTLDVESEKGKGSIFKVVFNRNE